MNKTALHAAHGRLGAKMGEFAGYDMPLYYNEGVIKEHEWVRSHAGIFDVSHMGQITLHGEGVVDFLERLTPSDFKSKSHGRAQYTVLLNEQGGIIDDLIITRVADDRFFAVINAGCKDKDIGWIESQMPDDVRMIKHFDRSLIALQGPWSERILHEVLGVEAHDLPYMHMMDSEALDGSEMFVSRVGYTGEDGFELSVFNESVEEIWEKLLTHSVVKPIGLAARDSLRLEMGYALYGHEIDMTTSPVEAGVRWIIGKNCDRYLGYERIKKEMESGTGRSLVALKLTDKGIAREGAEILNAQGEKIGALTSGGHSPILKASIGLGYVQAGYTAAGTKIQVNVRGKNIAAEICALPFVPSRTKSMKKATAAA
ncbi:MAG: glycine cleavage system aminomethyltransferase GcvT [Alphaproteobacteria bacterium]